MNTKTPLLLALLVLQLLIAGWIFYGGSSDAAPADKFVSATLDSVTGITLQDKQDNRVQLSKVEGSWRVGDLPADATKVAAILKKLTEIGAVWPVATTEEARGRFEVTEDSFQRRVQLFTGETLAADILLGTSPGFRRVHARQLESDMSDAVYSIDFANHEAPLGSDDWLDRGLLAFSDSVAELSWLDNWSLTQSAAEGADSLWQVDGDVADSAAAQALAARFSSLQVLGTVVEDAELKATFEIATRAADDTGADYRYQLFHNQEKDRYHIVRNDIDARFEVAGFVAEQMMVDRQALLASAPGIVDDTTNGALADDLVDQALQSLPGAATQ